MRYWFILELVNLLNMVLTIYDFENHVFSDNANGNLFTHPDNNKSQGYSGTSVKVPVLNIQITLKLSGFWIFQPVHCLVHPQGGPLG